MLQDRARVRLYPDQRILQGGRHQRGHADPPQPRAWQPLPQLHLARGQDNDDDDNDDDDNDDDDDDDDTNDDCRLAVSAPPGCGRRAMTWW